MTIIMLCYRKLYQFECKHSKDTNLNRTPKYKCDN